MNGHWATPLEESNPLSNSYALPLVASALTDSGWPRFAPGAERDYCRQNTADMAARQSLPCLNRHHHYGSQICLAHRKINRSGTMAPLYKRARGPSSACAPCSPCPRQFNPFPSFTYTVQPASDLHYHFCSHLFFSNNAFLPRARHSRFAGFCQCSWA